VIIITLQTTSLPEISVEMPQLTIAEASQHFSELIKLLQKVEDILDYQEAIEALDEPGENISLEALKKELG
jgi:hypothetical protein